ncbi:Crp/Fnr family transcriptional regulator [Roseococcus sp. YIM B11640]|uniref:Crp/Fnr family transcriptional regulator n=1 Tax=Roseococcus sp. YIM B11640 TaxID=3133973 RepID=UPI003C7C784C
MSQSCSACEVRDESLCGGLEAAELSALARLGRERVLERGETLIWAGDDAPICANLRSGVLKLSATMADGREQILGLLYPGDFVGRPFADQAGHSVTALTGATLCAFPRRGFEALLEGGGRLERKLLERTLTALDEARSRMLMLGRMTAGERVAGFLLEISRHVEAGPDGSFALPMTRAEMADVLGLTIETVSRQMTVLRRQGVIDLPSARLVAIRDRRALAALAETDRAA